MSKCRHFRKLFTEALYGELSKERKAIFEAHLKDCPACAESFARFRSTLAVMDERLRPEQSEWDLYWSRLNRRLQPVESSIPTVEIWRRRLAGVLRLKPVITYRLVTAVGLVIIGVVVGWFLFGQSDSKLLQYRQITDSRYHEVDKVTLSNRTGRYLERSKIILLGLVNLNPEEEDSGLLDLNYQRKVSKELIQEAGFLKKELTDREQQKLIDLIMDLEYIMRQITDLEAEYNLRGIELIRSEVDQRAILLKINLNELRRGSENENRDFW
jgi:hypothetical protein